MMPTSWQPTANLATLRARATLLAQIRAFFAARDVLEVQTPVLATTAIADYHLELFTTQRKHSATTLYLQPSPEAAMKRLLAAGSGCIYQISQAFRQEQCGKLHQPEFTLLEWYRVQFTYHDLMDEVDALLQTTLATAPAHRLSYAEVFKRYLNFCPHQATTADLATITQQQGITLESDHSALTKDDYLDLLLSHCIEPKLGLEVPVFIYDYPASQAALAKLRRVDDYYVAERFEVYYRGIELANGYHELTDATEQAARFNQMSKQRQQHGKTPIAVDTSLLAALAHGLPACAGIALGLDRLLLVKLQAASVSAVQSFGLGE